jgi:hypothetical protein
MSAVIPAQFSANYDDDQKMIDELNKHFEIEYFKDKNEIYFSINFDKDDHYVTVLVDKDELVDAISRAVAKPVDF